MPHLRVVNVRILSMGWALAAHALEARGREQSTNKSASPELESINVSAVARDRTERWMDSSHGFATDRNVALTHWVGSFFWRH